MKLLAFAFYFCFAVNVLKAQNLHPVIKYPNNHLLAGQVIDTALVGAPVQLSSFQAKQYFPDFNPQTEIALSNVGSGIEYEWYVVRIPVGHHGEYLISSTAFLHEEFSPGLFHGSILFQSYRDFEFSPQNKLSKKLSPFKSPYLVASFEGLRKRGMPFKARNLIAGNLIASWNFYTLKGTLAMAVGSKKLAENKNLLKTNIYYNDLAKNLYFQGSTFDSFTSSRIFAVYLNKALNQSYKQAYNPLNLTCNHAIENVIDEASAIYKKNHKKNLFTDLQDATHKRYISHFHLHLVEKGHATRKRVPINMLTHFYDYFKSAMDDHRPTNIYGRVTP